MKKIVFSWTLVFIISLGLFSTVFAKTTDDFGPIRSTDILATINGYPVVSYNVNGKTAIVLEDLIAHTEPLTKSPSYDKKVVRGKPGKVMGRAYKAATQTAINGQAVPAYSIFGKTCVLLEDLGNLTGSPYANYGFSKYFMKTSWDGTSRTIALTALVDNFFLVQNDVGVNIGLYMADKDAKLGTVELFDNFVSKTSTRFSNNGLIPLQLMVHDALVDGTVGYLFGDKVWLDTNAIAVAYKKGYYHKTTYEEGIAYFKQTRCIGLDAFRQFDTDSCSVLYNFVGGLPHGSSASAMAIIEKNGDYADITSLFNAYYSSPSPQTMTRYAPDVQNMRLSENQEMLLFDMNGKPFALDIKNAKLIP